MKIVSLQTHALQVPIDRRVGHVAETKGFRFHSHIVLVSVQTDVGLTGWGEVNGSPDWSGETAAGAKALIDQHFAPRLVGADPRQIRLCLKKLEKTWGNSFAKAGIEMALFDLLGKSLGVPVYQLLGGAVRSRVIPLRFPIMPLPAEPSAQIARALVAEGFGTVKLKVGHDPLDFDLHRIGAVRDAIGPGIRLTVDANGGWTESEAIRAIPELDRLGVAFLEQPVHRENLEGLARVRRQSTLPIMADEAVFTPKSAWQCLKLGACDILSVYPGKHGGLLPTLEIVAMAEAAGVQCAIGSNVEWDLASSAMAHLAVALPNITVEQHAADIIGPVFHTTRCCSPALYSGQGTVELPDIPGLGLTLDPNLMDNPQHIN